MSTQNIRIQGISLYDIDIKSEPLSEDEESSQHEFNSSEQISTLNEPLTDEIIPKIKDEIVESESSIKIEEIEVSDFYNQSAGSSLADFKNEIETDDGIIKQTWQNYDENIQIKEEVIDNDDKSPAKRKPLFQIVKLSPSQIASPPTKIFKLNSGQIIPQRTLNLSDFKKFKIVKPSGSASSSTPHKFIQIKKPEVSQNVTIKTEVDENNFSVVKQEPDVDLPIEHNSDYEDSDNFSEFDTDHEEEKKVNPESSKIPQNIIQNKQIMIRNQQKLPYRSVGVLKKVYEGPLPTVSEKKTTVSYSNMKYNYIKNVPIIMKKTTTVTRYDNRRRLPLAKSVILPSDITVKRMVTSAANNKLPSEDILKKCQICKLAFATEKEFNHHKQKTCQGTLPTETVGGKKFRCMRCPSSFDSRGLLYAHLQWHEKIWYDCGVCARKFSQKARLAEHMLSHEGTDPFQCKICPKRFPREDLLSQHMKYQHSVIRDKYKCSVCDYRTHVKQNFDKHENMHLRFVEKLQKNKFFHCGECPQSFRDEDVLKDHKAHVHGK